MTTFKFNSRRRQLESKITRCEKLGVNMTMTQAAIEAKRNHSFVNRTGTLERSVGITRPAIKKFAEVVGEWGSKDVAYARRIEEGFSGEDSLGRSFDQKALPFLVPAAKAKYPNLARNIRECMRRG